MRSPEASWTVDPRSFRSRARNTPFSGQELTGKVMHTFFGGTRTVADGMPLAGAVA